MVESDQTRPVVLVTDFGIVDDFAGVCHAVIAQRAPGAHVIHLTHGIDPQNVLQGAIVLKQTLPYTPVAVHLAVVDPGVGTARRGIAVDCADGRTFIGPDNGLMVPAIERAGGAVSAVSIEREEHMIHPVSATFHGRDVFAPAAAYVAGGGAIADLGPSIDPASLVRIDIPVAQRTQIGLVGTVWYVDRFGNTALGIQEAELAELLGDAVDVELTIRNERLFAQVARTFDLVREGHVLVYIDSYGAASIAVNKGSMAEIFRINVGDEVTLTPAVAGSAQPGHAATVAMIPRAR